MNENLYKKYLLSTGHTTKATATRISNARKAETILNANLDSIVSNNNKTFVALYLLNKMDGTHEPLQTALRSYYRSVNGSAFPKLKDYKTVA